VQGENLSCASCHQHGSEPVYYKRGKRKRGVPESLGEGGRRKKTFLISCARTRPTVVPERRKKRGGCLMSGEQQPEIVCPNDRGEDAICSGKAGRKRKSHSSPPEKTVEIVISASGQIG